MSDGAFVSTRIRYDENTGRRQGHLMALLPLSRKNDDNEQVLQEFRVYVELSAFLAYKHLQLRSGAVLPELPGRLEGCDFDLTYRHHDTQFSPLQAAREVLSYELPDLNKPRNYTWQQPTRGGENYWSLPQSSASNATNTYWTLPEEARTADAASRPEEFWSISSPQFQIVQEQVSNNITRTQPPRETATPSPVPPRRKRQRDLQSTATTTEQQKPFAILGAARSAVSQAIGILGGAWDVPQISSSSTASNLDDLPFFSRTVPTNSGDAHAIIVYLSQLGVFNVGVLHSEDSWGRRYEQDLQHYGSQYGVTVKSVAYSNTPQGLEQAMMQLEQLNLRYFVGILIPSAWKPVIQKAYDSGLIGNPENTWLIADLVELVGDGFTLNRETESDIAVALHGTGVVFLQVTPHVLFDRALGLVASNKELQQEFIASHSDPELLENFTFVPDPGMSLFQYLTYDASVALGITACETPGLFTGREFYDQLLKVDFEGVSGRVNLHETTGTRLGDSLKYQIVNMVLDDYLKPTTMPLSEGPPMTFSADISSLIELSPQAENGTALGPVVHSVKPFVYFDNSTTASADLPYFEENLNLIPKGILYFGLVMALAVMLLSVAIAVWVLRNKTKYVVRASQPFFMVQLCVGTFILAATVIPMGWQEPKSGLDAACMSTPWLFSGGFAVVISALFGKARRINQLVGGGTGFRRCRVKPRDVMKPFFFLMSVNVALLTAWSATPWRISWHRIAVSNNVDIFGRRLESYGVCRSGSNWHFLFSVPLVITNVMFLCMATWQSYKARTLPSELSEASYLAVSLVGLTETFSLGLTMVFVVISNPTAYYVVASVMICVGCMAILGPMFGPKFAQRNIKQPRGRMAASIVMRPGVAGRISGIHNSAFSSAPSGSGYRGSGSGWMSTSGSSHEAMPLSSGALTPNTFHSTRRAQDAEMTPFGEVARPSSDRGLRTRALSTHPEEDDIISDSFHAG